MTTPTALGIGEARTRLHELTVIDVRTPGEYAAGHLPGALNIPLDHIQRALPDIRDAAHRKDVLIVCASGARSENACEILAENDITTTTLSGGTGAWTAAWPRTPPSARLGPHRVGHGAPGPPHGRCPRRARPSARRSHPPGLPDPVGLHRRMGWSSPHSPTPAAWPRSSPNFRTTAPVPRTSTARWRNCAAADLQCHKGGARLTGPRPCACRSAQHVSSARRALVPRRHCAACGRAAPVRTAPPP